MTLYKNVNLKSNTFIRRKLVSLYINKIYIYLSEQKNFAHTLFINLKNMFRLFYAIEKKRKSFT